MSPKAGLDKATVVQAAADLVNAEGVDALSLGRVAAQLGVRPPSLYNHVDGLSGLHRELRLLNARLLGDRLSQAAIGKAGPDAAFAIAQAYRTYIKESPGLYLATLRAANSQAPPDRDLQAAEDRVVQVALAVVAAFDLHSDEAVHAVRALRSVVHGFATLEVAGGFGLPIDCDESFRRLLAMLIAGLRAAPSSAKSQQNTTF
jgi:AcrR family transcriptional regulator